MKREGFLGIDLGGSGAKAAVFDRSGQLLGFGQVSKTPVTTPEGHTEIAIDEVYAAAKQAAGAAIRESGAAIRALAVSSQGQTFVSLDAEDRPLHPAIIWYDSRATEQTARLRARVEALSAGELLPRIETIASAPKILWLRDRFPELMRRARRYLLLPDYLTYRLTGRAVTDPTTAGSTALYAPGAPDYSPAMLQAAEIDRAQLADIFTPGTAAATVSPAAAAEWGLEPDTLLVAGTNDQYCGALGAGNCRLGIISETTGTCLALVTLTDRLPRPLPPGMLGGSFPVPPYDFALAYAKTAGVVLEWFRREFTPEKSLRELDALAADIPVGCNGVTMLPHFEGMVSPLPNLAARGAFANLSLSHTLGDLYRAILESLTFSLRENIDFLHGYGMEMHQIRSIGGGARSDFWLQMKADATGLPVDRPAVTEAATMGAAMLAAAGAGAFPTVVDSVNAFYRTARTFTPRPEATEQYEAPYRRYLNLCRSLYGAEEAVPI